MQFKTLFIISAFLFSNIAVAELPERGALMENVKAKFGTPIRTSTTIGQPPITRWYYATFTVAFEYEHVIHAFPRNTSVEELSSKNNNVLTIPDTSTKTDEATETNQETPKKEPEEESTTLNNSYFKNTPNLIK